MCYAQNEQNPQRDPDESDENMTSVNWDWCLRHDCTEEDVISTTSTIFSFNISTTGEKHKIVGFMLFFLCCRYSLYMYIK